LQTGELPDRSAGALGLEIPQGAVERVARTAGRQQRLQGLPRNARLDALADRLDLPGHGGRRVLPVVDALRLAAPDPSLLVDQLDDQRVEGIERVAGDVERRLDRPALQRGSQAQPPVDMSVHV
jgi:hypothetical protein